MKSWQAPIPQNPKNKDRKRCYIYRRKILGKFWAGGKVVWLTDREKTLAHIKYSNMRLDEVLERDKLEEYKKYLDQTIE